MDKVFHLGNTEDLFHGTWGKHSQPRENVITLATSIFFDLNPLQMMYGRGAPTRHTLIDSGILCGYFLHSFTPNLEPPTRPPPCTFFPYSPPPTNPLCIVSAKSGPKIVIDFSRAKYAC